MGNLLELRIPTPTLWFWVLRFVSCSAQKREWWKNEQYFFHWHTGDRMPSTSQHIWILCTVLWLDCWCGKHVPHRMLFKGESETCGDLEARNIMKHPQMLINDCFSWMICNHYMKIRCVAKHWKAGFGFQRSTGSPPAAHHLKEPVLQKR